MCTFHTHTHSDRRAAALRNTCRLDRQMTKLLFALTFALTLALTVWMNSKWPPSCWKVMGLWLKNHWKATSSEVSCVALQLSTTLSPTVTSTRLGLSSTRMASGSTKLLHCHLRLTQSHRHRPEFDRDITGGGLTGGSSTQPDTSWATGARIVSG